MLYPAPELYRKEFLWLCVFVCGMTFKKSSFKSFSRPTTHYFLFWITIYFDEIFTFCSQIFCSQFNFCACYKMDHNCQGKKCFKDIQLETWNWTKMIRYVMLVKVNLIKENRFSVNVLTWRTACLLKFPLKH